MKINKIQAAQKQLDRALANLDRVANYLEDTPPLNWNQQNVFNGFGPNCGKRSAQVRSHYENCRESAPR